MSTIMSRMMGSSSTTSTLRIAAFSLMLFSLFYRRLYTWKVEAKDGPFAGYADLQPEFAAHRFDIAAADEQAQTGAAYRRSQGARGAHEFLEDLLLVFQWNAFALVAHAHQHDGRIFAMHDLAIINLAFGKLRKGGGPGG